MQDLSSFFYLDVKERSKEKIKANANSLEGTV
jgi:hypothetical protein